jgi:hypothetical protein
VKRLAPVLSDAEFRRRLAATMARHERDCAAGTRRLRACPAPTMAGWRA